jgi:hypothetical protein
VTQGDESWDDGGHWTREDAEIAAARNDSSAVRTIAICDSGMDDVSEMFASGQPNDGVEAVDNIMLADGNSILETLACVVERMLLTPNLADQHHGMGLRLSANDDMQAMVVL